MASHTHCLLYGSPIIFIMLLITSSSEIYWQTSCIVYYFLGLYIFIVIYLVGRTHFLELTNLMIYHIHMDFVMSLHVKYLIGCYMPFCIPFMHLIY